MMIIMGLNQLGIDYADPKVIMWSRVLLVAVQLVTLAINGYIYSKAKSTNDQTQVTVTKAPGMKDAFQAASSGGKPQPSTSVQTVAQYDQEAVISGFDGFQALLMGFALQVRIVQPLIIQADWVHDAVQLALVQILSQASPLLVAWLVRSRLTALPILSADEQDAGCASTQRRQLTSVRRQR